MSLLTCFNENTVYVRHMQAVSQSFIKEVGRLYGIQFTTHNTHSNNMYPASTVIDWFSTDHIFNSITNRSTKHNS